MIILIMIIIILVGVGGVYMFSDGNDANKVFKPKKQKEYDALDLRICKVNENDSNFVKSILEKHKIKNINKMSNFESKVFDTDLNAYIKKNNKDECKKNDFIKKYNELNNDPQPPPPQPSLSPSTNKQQQTTLNLLRENSYINSNDPQSPPLSPSTTKQQTTLNLLPGFKRENSSFNLTDPSPLDAASTPQSPSTTKQQTTLNLLPGFKRENSSFNLSN